MHRRCAKAEVYIPILEICKFFWIKCIHTFMYTFCKYIWIARVRVEDVQKQNCIYMYELCRYFWIKCMNHAYISALQICIDDVQTQTCTYIYELCTHTWIEVYINTYEFCRCICLTSVYGVATISRLLKRSLLQNIISFIGLFCKRDLSF